MCRLFSETDLIGAALISNLYVICVVGHLGDILLKVKVTRNKRNIKTKSTSHIHFITKERHLGSQVKAKARRQLTTGKGRA